MSQVLLITISAPSILYIYSLSSTDILKNKRVSVEVKDSTLLFIVGFWKYILYPVTQLKQ